MNYCWPRLVLKTRQWLYYYYEIHENPKNKRMGQACEFSAPQLNAQIHHSRFPSLTLLRSFGNSSHRHAHKNHFPIVSMYCLRPKQFTSSQIGLVFIGFWTKPDGTTIHRSNGFVAISNGRRSSSNRVSEWVYGGTCKQRRLHRRRRTKNWKHISRTKKKS